MPECSAGSLNRSDPVTLANSSSLLMQKNQYNSEGLTVYLASCGREDILLQGAQYSQLGNGYETRGLG